MPSAERSVYQNNHTELLFHIFLLSNRIPNEPTIYQLSSNSVSLSAIIALSESLLVVEVSSQGSGFADTDETVSAKHVSLWLLNYKR